MTLKDNTVHTVADPATFLASESLDLIFLWEQLVHSLMENLNISEFVLVLLNIRTHPEPPRGEEELSPSWKTVLPNKVTLITFR